MKKERPWRRYTTEVFVEKAKKRHGDRYTYDNAVYTFSNIKVAITCKIHGDFHMTPANHLFGLGCDRCADSKNGSACRKTHEQFMSELAVLWGCQYDYSETVYTRLIDKIKIKCRAHGTFEKSAIKHLSGQGCPECSKGV